MRNAFLGLVVLLAGALAITGCKTNPLAWPQNRAGVQLLRDQEFEQAVFKFDTALNKESRYGFALNNRGYGLIRTGDYHKALDDLELASRVNPGYSHAWNNLGVLYQLPHDDETAEQNYRRAMSLKKSYEEPYFNMARVYFARQEYDLALQYADKAITAYEETEDDEWEAANYLRSLILEQLGVKELENGDQSSNEDDSDDAEKMEDPAAKPTFAQLHPSVLGQ